MIALYGYCIMNTELHNHIDCDINGNSRQAVYYDYSVRDIVFVVCCNMLYTTIHTTYIVLYKSLQHTGAVSYTHLDVYKRQHYG